MKLQIKKRYKLVDIFLADCYNGCGLSLGIWGDFRLCMELFHKPIYEKGDKTHEQMGVQIQRGQCRHEKSAWRQGR